MARNFRDPAPSLSGQLLQPPGGKGGFPTTQGLWEGRSQAGDTYLQPRPQEGTQLERGGLSGLPVRVRLARRKGWLLQLGQDPGGAHVRNRARCPLNKGSGDTYFMITSDSLSTGFSSGLQEEETHNQGVLHWGFVLIPDGVSSVMPHPSQSLWTRDTALKPQTIPVSARHPGSLCVFP